MVKVHKMFCIEHDIAQRLKGVNASALVEELLTKHFKETDLKRLGAEKLGELRKLVIAKNENEQKIKELVNGH